MLLTLGTHPSFAGNVLQYVDVSHKAFELPYPLLWRQLQAFPQQRPVHVLLVGFDHRIGLNQHVLEHGCHSWTVP